MLPTQTQNPPVSGRPISKRAVATFRALCCNGWPAKVFIPALLDALHDVIPSSRNLFDWTDNDGLPNDPKLIEAIEQALPGIVPWD